jgi:hypothetical protein
MRRVKRILGAGFVSQPAFARSPQTAASPASACCGPAVDDGAPPPSLTCATDGNSRCRAGWKGAMKPRLEPIEPTAPMIGVPIETRSSSARLISSRLALPAPTTRRTASTMPAKSTASLAAKFSRRAISFSSSSVLASYQAAISASTSGMFGHPKSALSPLARRSLLVGSTQSTP